MLPLPFPLAATITPAVEGQLPAVAPPPLWELVVTAGSDCVCSEGSGETEQQLLSVQRGIKQQQWLQSAPPLPAPPRRGCTAALGAPWLRHRGPILHLISKHMQSQWTYAAQRRSPVVQQKTWSKTGGKEKTSGQTTRTAFLGSSVEIPAQRRWSSSCHTKPRDLSLEDSPLIRSHLLAAGSRGLTSDWSISNKGRGLPRTVSRPCSGPSTATRTTSWGLSLSTTCSCCQVIGRD